jgi:cobaltochelatase CobT
MGQTIDLPALRGVIDGLVLRLQHTDLALHRSLCPAPAIDRFVFELLEQLRSESLLEPYMLGQRANLRQRFEAWCNAFVGSGLLETNHGILLFTVAQVCWTRVTGEPLCEQWADAIEGTRIGLAPTIGVSLAGLRTDRLQQRAYAQHAFKIAQTVGEMIRAEPLQTTEDTQTSTSEENEALGSFALLLTFDEPDADAGLTTAATGDSKVLGASTNTYRIFTTRYDEEVPAASLVRAERLRAYRAQMDDQLQDQGIHLVRVARQLMALLAQPERTGWDFAEEDGVLDGRRLMQLVVSPTERRIFKQPQTTPHTNSMVSFLIDCSGSMKAHITTISLLVDVMARALDMVGIDNEILGFTTGGWNGGRARNDWMKAGEPKHPGRLNEARHLVFKDATQNWRRARQSISALLAPELFREGIDGEAVEWACSRMLAHGAQRRILIVISDGCPMDTATQQVNDPHYLDQHLQQVVASHERTRDVSICGLGVGLDLSAYYSRCIGIDSDRKVDMRLFQDVIELMAGRHMS